MLRHGRLISIVPWVMKKTPHRKGAGEVGDAVFPACQQSIVHRDGPEKYVASTVVGGCAGFLTEVNRDE